MTSEESKRDQPPAAGRIGAGMVMKAQCWTCRTPKIVTGGKWIRAGTSRLFRCGECLQKQKQEIKP